MIRADSRAIGWSGLVWVCLILAINFSVMAAPPDSPPTPASQAVDQDQQNGTAAASGDPAPQAVDQDPENNVAPQTETPAQQSAEPKPEGETETPPDDPAPQAEDQDPKIYVPTGFGDPAPKVTEEAQEVEAAGTTPDSAPQGVDPAPKIYVPPGFGDPAPQITEEAQEVEAAGTTPDSAPQGVDPAPKIYVPPGFGIPAPQITEEAQEAETTTPAGDPVPLAIEQDPKTETATAVNPSDAQGKKSIFKAVFSNMETTFTMATGIRKDDFQWSIAGDAAGANPNVLSELTWSDVDSYEVSLANRTLFNRQLYLRGEVTYAFIQNGRIQDSDYREDNRGDEYSRSISDSSGDQIWGASLAAGYPFFFMQERLMLAPLLGYAYHAMNLRITDGEQVITWAGGPALGPLDGLNSTYRSTWAGPWVGCDLRYRPSANRAKGGKPMEFGLSFEYHYADYEAEANWNLRSDFAHPISFEHTADGYGIMLAGEWLIGLTQQWDFLFRTTYQYWKTGNGLDKVFNSDSTVDHTRLNEVEWRNHSFMVGANFRF